MKDEALQLARGAPECGLPRRSRYAWPRQVGGSLDGVESVSRARCRRVDGQSDLWFAPQAALRSVSRQRVACACVCTCVRVCVCVCVCVFMCVYWEGRGCVCGSLRDPIHYFCSLPGRVMSQSMFTLLRPGQSLGVSQPHRRKQEGRGLCKRKGSTGKTSLWLQSQA